MNLIQCAVQPNNSQSALMAQNYLLGESDSEKFDFHPIAAKLNFIERLDPLTRSTFSADLSEGLYAALFSGFDDSTVFLAFCDWLSTDAQTYHDDYSLNDMVLMLESILSSLKSSYFKDEMTNDLCWFVVGALTNQMPIELLRSILETSDILAFGKLIEVDLSDALSKILKTAELLGQPPQFKWWSVCSYVTENIISHAGSSFISYLIDEQNAEHVMAFESYKDIADEFNLKTLAYFTSEKHCFDHNSDSYDKSSIEDALKVIIKPENMDIESALQVLLELAMEQDDLEAEQYQDISHIVTDEQRVGLMADILMNNDLFDLESAFYCADARANEVGASQELCEYLEKFELIDGSPITYNQTSERLEIRIDSQELLRRFADHQYLDQQEFLEHESDDFDEAIKYLIKEHDVFGSINDLNEPQYGFSGFDEDELREALETEIRIHHVELEFLFS